MPRRDIGAFDAVDTVEPGPEEATTDLAVG